MNRERSKTQNPLSADSSQKKWLVAFRLCGPRAAAPIRDNSAQISTPPGSENPVADSRGEGHSNLDIHHLYTSTGSVEVMSYRRFLLNEFQIVRSGPPGAATSALRVLAQPLH